VSGQGTSEIVVNAAGNYEVTIVDTDNGCSSVCSKNVILDNTVRTCSISGPGIINCNTPDGQIVLTASTDATNASFTWSATSGGNIVSGQGTSEIVVN